MRLDYDKYAISIHIESIIYIIHMDGPDFLRYNYQYRVLANCKACRYIYIDLTTTPSNIELPDLFVHHIVIILEIKSGFGTVLGVTFSSTWSNNMTTCLSFHNSRCGFFLDKMTPSRMMNSF